MLPAAFTILKSDIKVTKQNKNEIIMETKFTYDAYIIFVRHIYGDEVSNFVTLNIYLPK